MKPMTKFMLAAFAATTLSPAFVMAQTQDAKNQGYLLDTSGGIVRSGAGLCWHTSDWTPARAVASCDPVTKPVAAAMPVQHPMVLAQAAPATPEPAKTQSKKVNLSGDALFAFDKSVLKPEGKTMLDDMLRQFKVVACLQPDRRVDVEMQGSKTVVGSL